ncbi:MAG: YeeE/YedE family protein [Proteobacteria bacterium]|nr:YeeE/YedE family protein [Pseudomonadota bacterium]
MDSRSKNLAAAYISGLIFALGLGLSGMTQPNKIIGFLNITGPWDPSLAFVMLGAITVHGLAYQLWLKKKAKPIFAASFSIPINKKIDGRLILGASLFGIGWGMSGYCPGPAILSVASLQPGVLIFTASMIAGMALFHVYERGRQQKHLKKAQDAQQKPSKK